MDTIDSDVIISLKYVRRFSINIRESTLSANLEGHTVQLPRPNLPGLRITVIPPRDGPYQT